MQHKRLQGLCTKNSQWYSQTEGKDMLDRCDFGCVLKVENVWDRHRSTGRLFQACGSATRYTTAAFPTHTAAHIGIRSYDQSSMLPLLHHNVYCVQYKVWREAQRWWCSSSCQAGKPSCRQSSTWSLLSTSRWPSHDCCHKPGRVEATTNWWQISVGTSWY